MYYSQEDWHTGQRELVLESELSCQLTNHLCLLSPNLLLRKFSASSFYPTHCDNNFPSVTYLNNRTHNHFNITGRYDGNDSDIENKAEWFDKPSNNTPSKMSDTMALEVSSLYFFHDYS